MASTTQAGFAEDVRYLYFRSCGRLPPGPCRLRPFLRRLHKGRVVQNGFRGREREELLRLGTQRFFNGNIPNGRKVKGKYGELIRGHAHNYSPAGKEAALA